MRHYLWSAASTSVSWTSHFRQSLVIKSCSILSFFSGTNDYFFVPLKKPYKTIACKGGGTRQKRVPLRVPPVFPYKSTTCGVGGTKHTHLAKTISVYIYLYI